MIAEQTNQPVDNLVKLEEKVTGKLMPSRKNGFAAQEGAIMNKFSKSDQLFLQEKALILQLAQKESFVIVGRAANAILEGVPNTMRVYVYASEDFKVPRVKEYYHLDTDKDARKKMEQTDKQRRNYFHYYSDMVWGSSDGHDLMIDTSLLGIEETARQIENIADIRFSCFLKTA